MVETVAVSGCRLPVEAAAGPEVRGPGCAQRPDRFQWSHVAQLRKAAGCWGVEIYVKSNHNCYLLVYIYFFLFAYITYLNAHLETKYCKVNIY